MSESETRPIIWEKWGDIGRGEIWDAWLKFDDGRPTIHLQVTKLGDMWCGMAQVPSFVRHNHSYGGISDFAFARREDAQAEAERMLAAGLAARNATEGGRDVRE